MTLRRFAPRCGECRQKAMVLATVPYQVTIDHDGKSYDVGISDLSVPKCQNCGTLSIDEVASEQIDKAFRQRAGLLTSEEIRRGRTAVGYGNQQEFATCLGVSVSTVSRWENGVQVQQSFYDDILRAFFKFPELRRFLAVRHGLQPRDTEPVAAVGNSIVRPVVVCFMPAPYQPDYGRHAPVLPV